MTSNLTTDNIIKSIEIHTSKTIQIAISDNNTEMEFSYNSTKVILDRTIFRDFNRSTCESSSETPLDQLTYLSHHIATMLNIL